MGDLFLLQKGYGTELEAVLDEHGKRLNQDTLQITHFVRGK